MIYSKAKYLVVFIILILLSQIHLSALYWEDDFPANDPENAYRTPKGCVLGSIWERVKRSTTSISNFLLFGGKEPADMGPPINKRKKGLVVLGCGVLGGVTGAVIGLATEQEGGEQTAYRVTSVSIGVISGIIVGIWVVPESFSYDDQARWQDRPLRTVAVPRRELRATLWQGRF